MRKLAVLLFVATIILNNVSGQYSAKLNIKGSVAQSVLLLKYYGDKTYIVDSASTGVRESVIFMMDKDDLPGLYAFVIDQRDELPFIYNNENIEYSTRTGFINDSLQIIASEENKLYRLFTEYDDVCRKKLELLSPIIDYYPEQDKFYKEAERQFIDVQKKRNGFIRDLAKNHADRFASKLIAMQLSPYIDPAISEWEKLEYMKKEYFTGISFTDTSLMRTNAYTDKVISYLGLYSNSNYTQSQLENEFIKAVDVILKNVDKNQSVYEFILEYLLGGFEKYGFNNVLQHIAENYSEKEACEDETNESSLQKRLEGYRKLAVGNPAPLFSTVDMGGNAVNLKELNYDKILVIFWATWCPHCKETLPVIKELYDKQVEKTWEVVAISLDTNEVAWKNYVTEKDYGWIDCNELKGWDSPTALKYFVYATPTIFVIDRQKRIVAKPISVNGLITNLSNSTY